MKPIECPFCGTMDGEVRSEYFGRHYVQCGCCECSGPAGRTPGKAIALWNDRIVEKMPEKEESDAQQTLPEV